MRKLLSYLFILFFSNLCAAQQTNINDLHFNRLSIKEGLPEGVVISMLQDKEGYIWICTQGGLVRYDGYSAKVYKFSIDDPLRAAVTAIYEDRSGELWIGSAYQGLYHYNRSADTFYHYPLTSKASNGFTVTFIISMHEDLHGNLWMIMADFQGKSRMVNMFDTKKHQFTQFGFSEKGNHHIDASELSGWCEGSNGHTWIGSNNGIYEYNASADKLIPHFATTDSSKQRKFDLLTKDEAHPNIVWMNVWDVKNSKGEGVLAYNTVNNTSKTYHHIPGDSTSLSNDSVFLVEKDLQNKIWFSTGNGLSVFEPLTQHFINYNIQNKDAFFWANTIFWFTEDNQGNFWCRTGDNILFFDGKTKLFTRYKPNHQNANTLPVTGYTNILVDRSGTLWVGTYPEGLYWINNVRSLFSVYKNEPGQAHYFPGGGNSSFAEDKDGTFWLAATNGLYHWYPSSDSFALVKALKEREEPNSWHLSTTLVDSKGIVWCCPHGKGLFGYNPKTGELKHYINNQEDSTSLSVNYIASLFEDSEGVLWIGTWGGGLCRFNRETENFKRYPYIWLKDNNNPPDKFTLNDPVIYTICEDKKGELWLGNNNSGVNRFNRQSGVFTPVKNKWLIDNVVGKIFEDSKGKIWLGTHASGLFKYDPQNNTLKKFSEKDGLLYNGVLGINEDNSNNLWVTSNRGISVINLQTNKISTLSSRNGLPAEPDYTLFYKTSRGRFLMECNNGFISFNPEQLKADTSLPIVHIESVEFIKPQIHGDKQTDSIIYSYGKNIINLHYNENRITFNYVGLQYQNSALNQYAYRLEGYDKDWIQAGTQRKVTYTNLSPDTYIFHVKSANSDGVWNPQEQTLAIIISPPWWLTWWAYLIYIIIFIAALRAYIVYRSRSLLKKNRLLEEKVEQRTHQLSEANEELKVSQENIEAQRDELANAVDVLKSTQAQLIQSEKMASLGELTAGIAHEIQNPLNFVNNFSEVNIDLTNDMNDENDVDEIKAIANDIKQNSEKILFHGRRADAIVKNMMQHSRQNKGVKEPTDINALCDEYLRLSYHGLRAKDKTFNADFKTDFDEGIDKINIVPQDIGRVLLNLFNNAFYATSTKALAMADGEYKPLVSIQTKKMNDKVEIKVSDNGNGIPSSIIDKIFQPFFTTKPTGQGTGLGLSLAYDIITKEHNGTIKAESKEGEGSAFIIQLPKTA